MFTVENPGFFDFCLGLAYAENPIFWLKFRNFRRTEISAIENFLPKEGPELFLLIGGYTTLLLFSSKRIFKLDTFCM